MPTLLEKPKSILYIGVADRAKCNDLIIIYSFSFITISATAQRYIFAFALPQK
jgi:hypothetical protein